MVSYLQTGEKSYFVLRGQKVTRDKNSEIKLTTSQLEVSDANKQYCGGTTFPYTITRLIAVTIKC